MKKTLIIAITTLFMSIPLLHAQEPSAQSEPSADNAPSAEDVVFEQRFKEISKQGVQLDYGISDKNPWGAPNPGAAPELQQFAFMVGQHNCMQALRGINPNNPDQEYQGDLKWFAYYALDGRAIRDEFYSMGGHGEQTRAYDSFAKEWWVTFATVPGMVQLVAEPKPGRGSFSAAKRGVDMVMTSEGTDSKGDSFTQTITFYQIRKDGFKWKSDNVYPDRTINTGSMSCKKVAGPDM